MLKTSGEGGSNQVRYLNDVRESTAVKIFEKFLDMGAELAFYDPLIPDITKKDTHFTSVNQTPEKSGVVRLCRNHDRSYRSSI